MGLEWVKVSDMVATNKSFHNFTAATINIVFNLLHVCGGDTKSIPTNVKNLNTEPSLKLPVALSHALSEVYTLSLNLSYQNPKSEKFNEAQDVSSARNSTKSVTPMDMCSNLETNGEWICKYRR